MSESENSGSILLIVLIVRFGASGCSRVSFCPSSLLLLHGAAFQIPSLAIGIGAPPLSKNKSSSAILRTCHGLQLFVVHPQQTTPLVVDFYRCPKLDFRPTANCDFIAF